jgi:hypothetical protein
LRSGVLTSNCAASSATMETFDEPKVNSRQVWSFGQDAPGEAQNPNWLSTFFDPTTS